MPTRATTPPWECPQCGRTVPAREPQCHCGVLRSESPKSPGADDRAAGRFVRTALGLAVAAAAAYGLYTADLQRERRQQAAEAARQERLRLENPPPSPESVPPETAPRSFAPSPYTPPVGGSFAFPSPKPEPSPVAVKPRANPADDAGPSPTSMEEAWARATQLLEPTLEKISAETAELQQQYQPFASTCLASPDANWLVAMRSGAFVREGGMPYSRFGVTVNCDFGRRELIGRANVIKAEMEAAERLAHSRSVLPGHWRKLVETYQLDIWGAY